MFKEKCEVQKENKIFKILKMFFNGCTFLGFILILLSIIFTLLDKTYNLCPNWLTEIISNLLSTIGIALFIGAFFDFSKNSKEFIDFVSNILSDIVVSKTFLQKLSKNDKEQAIAIILKPSGNQLQQYSNINNYFQKKIVETTDIFDTNFKTNLYLQVDVQRNTQSGKIESYVVLRYRIYKINNKFKPIQTWLDKPGSKLLSTKIMTKNKIINIDKSQEKKVEDNGNTKIPYQKSSFDIPDDLHNEPYLTVEYKIIEEGYDHWTTFNWSSLTPYDGIDFVLKCYGNLTIKEYFLFDEGDSYNVDLNENKNTMSIISNVWINSYTGFTIVVSETKEQSSENNCSFDATDLSNNNHELTSQ